MHVLYYLKVLFIKKNNMVNSNGLSMVYLCLPVCVVGEKGQIQIQQ